MPRPLPPPRGPADPAIDWTREDLPRGVWIPSRALLRSIRRYQRHAQGARPWSPLVKAWSVLAHRFWSAVSGADIPLNARLGGGLLIPHPNGIVIHPDAVIGSNCLIFQQVTIGVGGRPGVPTIGHAVNIGAGAKVLGGITVGDGAQIGANAVVLSDVPAGRTAVGIPARLLGD